MMDMNKGDQAIDYTVWGRREKDTPAAKAKPQRADWRGRLKKIVFSNPKISVKDLKTELDVPLSAFTIANIRRDFLDDIKLLRRLGHLKRN